VSFPVYPSYKDSGVEWLGAIPSDWQVKKFRHTFLESDEKIEGEVVGPMLSVSGYRGIEVKDYDDENRRRSDEDLIGYRIVRPGQLVVNTMWLNYAGLGVSAHEGHVSPAYRAYRFADESADRGFIHYLMRSSAYVLAYTQLLTGVRPNSLQMSRADLMDFPIVLPPQPAQRTIAAFLDRETAKIDALIEEQRRLIALLKEKRQVVISHAVTKGLKPDAPMKDTGIEWLGAIPAHWEVKPLKYIAPDFCDGPFGSGLKSEHYVDEGVRVIRLQNIKSGGFDGSDAAFIDEAYFRASLTRHEVVAGDLLVAGLGDERNLVGRACVAPADIGCAIVKADCFRFRLTSAYDPPFVAAQLSAGASFAAGRLSSGSTRTRIPATVMAQRSVASPPLQEQVSISLHLGRIIEDFDRLASAAGAAITLLTERRAALVSAAVTGKIDVRVSAKVLPFPVDRVRARGLIAAEIIERSAHQATFGRVKLQKIAFLTEAHVGVDELAGSYTREAAGPLDRAMIDEMESSAQNIAGVTVDQAGGTGTTVCYRPGEQRGAHRNELADWLGADRMAKLDKLIADFAALTTKSAEAVATLYGVWNDAIIEGASPTEEDIISGFLNDWHPEKPRKFRADELPEWLGWMRRHGIVPTGTGPKTATGRLFT
jgi:restriction endonuclease S subunit